MKGQWILRTALALTLLLLLAAGLGQAQEPQGVAAPLAAMGTAFTYQGRLTNSSGNPLTGTYDFKFSLFDASSLGSQVGSTVNKDDVSVGSGLFTVVLDFGSNAFTGDARWLEIEVKEDSEGSYTLLSPRQELTPTPYALNADLLDGQQASAFASDPHDHWGETWTGSGTGLTMRHDAPPNPVFKIEGTFTNFEPQFFIDGGTLAEIRLRHTSYDPDADWRITSGGGSVALRGYLHISNDAIDRLVISNSGDVGIGTTPGTRLDVSGAIRTDSQLMSTVGTGTAPLSVASSTKVDNLNADLLDGLDSSEFWQLGGNAGTTPGTDFLGTTDSQALELHVNGARVLRLEPHVTSPNVIGGYSGNNVTSSVLGATIGGGGNSGSPNLVTDNHGTVGGGSGNRAGDNDGNPDSAHGATVAGGAANIAGYDYATVGGGGWNQATSTYATVPGGVLNVAQGPHSFAAGRRAKANHQGAFVWADSTDADFASERADQFRVRASGGARFDVNNGGWVNIYDDSTDLISTSSGAHLTVGGAWTDNSDRDLKANFSTVDGQAVLAQLADLPISTWNYKAESASTRHMGPTAQDFYAAFGLGADDKHIAALDTGGVALAAIQALHEQSQALEAENAALQQQVGELEARLAALELAAGQPASSQQKLPIGWAVLAGLGVVTGVVVQRRLPGGGR